jgi:cysteine desulfurase/selenocysteine lyase
VLSFNIKGLDPHQLAFQLDLEGIAVRSGHHCAYPLHRSLGIEKSVRASPHIYNTYEEIERLAGALARIRSRYMNAMSIIATGKLCPSC